MFCRLYFIVICVFASFCTSAQTKPDYAIIAYFAGGPSKVGTVNPQKITHIIYTFCTLRGNKIFLADTSTVRRLVRLKKKNPKLKVLLSLGGWGGCKTCSDLFSEAANRQAFALSVKRLNENLGTDGIDLDWEYPAVEGFPGHKFVPEDKNTFTLLIQDLRHVLGSNNEISFAAGGFQEYLEKSIDWLPVMQVVDRVNLMSYDLVNGYSTVTGHHTPRYSTSQNKESVDNAVNFLLKQGVPASKIAIGAAFYARVWQNVNNANNGLYQSSTFRNTVGIKAVTASYTKANGFNYFWDDTANAPYVYSPGRRLFATFDDNQSVKLKSEYVKQKGLNGIMFWQIMLDKSYNSLLGEIYQVLK